MTTQPKAELVNVAACESLRPIREQLQSLQRAPSFCIPANVNDAIGAVCKLARAVEQLVDVFEQSLKEPLYQ